MATVRARSSSHVHQLGNAIFQRGVSSRRNQHAAHPRASVGLAPAERQLAG